MFRAPFLPPEEPRRGVILMVVLILLTLFAIVGLSFALYGNAEAQAAQLGREAEVQPRPDAEPEMLLAFFLSQHLYDADDFTGVFSALRAHSLARNMYGYNYKRSAADEAFVSPNTVPFNGLGRLHMDAANNLPAMNPFGLDDYFLINYMFFPNDVYLWKGKNFPFLRDPERRNPRDSNQPVPPWRYDPSQPPGSFLGGFNAPYTYPDLNNMFLAAVKADGTVLAHSFHRVYPPGKGFGSLDRSNPNWGRFNDLRPEAKYMILRPRPIDQKRNPADPNEPELFPYPEDASGDVKNLIGSPGFFDGTRYYNNDSIWMDLGYPVMIAPDGRKFKPLFAPLVIDLDNRVNLSVHGNIVGNDRPKLLHLSNQGWGPWEVNLNKVLNADDQEWTNLFTGLKDPTDPRQLLQHTRYGFLDQNGQLTPQSYFRPHAPWFISPNPNMALPGRSSSPFYSPVDFDGANLGRIGPSGPIQLPLNDGKTFTCFARPQGLARDYGNGSPAERTDHPLLYNFFQPASDDRPGFGLSNMEALLRYSDTGSLALTSDLFRLCPLNFGGPGSERRRNLVTTHSFDLDRPGVMPWAHPNGSYQLRQITPTPPRWEDYPNQTSPNPIAVAPQTNKGEYGPDGRAGDATLGRLNLNRDLPAYPMPTVAGRINLNDQKILAQFKLAENARVQFAKEIYDRLRLLTTGTATAPLDPTIRKAEFDAHRWLAQLAVNIVDFIDTDDYITPFPWYQPKPNDPTTWQYVFGTELPRLVVNEAYIECDNDPADDRSSQTDKRAQLPHWFNFWVELHNPFSRDDNLKDSLYPANPVYNSAARLTMPKALDRAYGAYRLLISDSTALDTTIRDPGNVFGVPLDPTKLRRTVYHFTGTKNNPNVDAEVVLRSDGAYNCNLAGNNGFYVLGPDYSKGFPGNKTIETVKVTSPPALDADKAKSTYNSMTWYIPKSQGGHIYTNAELQTGLPKFNLFLQRLACPHVRPNFPSNPDQNYPFDPNLPYNPYITVDYMEQLRSNDGADYSADEQLNKHTPPTPDKRFSEGRRQPYAGHRSMKSPQKPDQLRAGEAQNTFFQHNAFEAPPVTQLNPVKFDRPDKPLPAPWLPAKQLDRFQWLVHLDRQLISPMELLHVSALKPHELTQDFALQKTGFGVAPDYFRYRLGRIVAQEQSRLYRMFELLEAGNRAMGTASGGRLPGKININTIWDPDTLAAICDPQSSNAFTSKLNVNTLFGQISQSRTPSGKFSETDNPFRGMATPFAPPDDKQFPAPPDDKQRNMGIKSTLLRSSGGQALLAAPGTDANSHPFMQDELLNKIYNHLTTRSNVFAVWVTVGFFEVVDDSVRPVKLGAEIGKAENRHVRHRMFAIVDRTNLSTLSNVAVASPPNNKINPGSSVKLPLDKVSGSTTSPPFSVPWNIKVGSLLTFEDPNNPETVIVTAVDPLTNIITANFATGHAKPQGVGAWRVWISFSDMPGPPPIFLSSLDYPSFNGVTDTTPTDVPILATLDKPPGGKPELIGSYEGLPWFIQQGSWLVVDNGPNQELVQVLGVNQNYPKAEPSDPLKPAPPSFQAVFTKPHASPFTIRFPNAKPGNPGPQPRFNPRDPVAAPIVRYVSIID